jgi:hypothetical protein
MHFSSLFNKREHPILPSIFWGIHREESEVGCLMSTSGQRTSGFLHCGKMTEEVAPVSMFIENRLGNIYKCTVDTKSRRIFNFILVSPTVLEEKNLPKDQLSLMGRSISPLTTMTYGIPSIDTVNRYYGHRSIYIYRFIALVMPNHEDFRTKRYHLFSVRYFALE